MANFDLTNMDNLLKDYYLGPIRDLINYRTILSRYVARNRKDVSGRQIVTPVMYELNQGLGSRAEDVALPAAGYERTQLSKTTIKYNYGALRITGPALEAMKNDRGSFTRAMPWETRMLTKSMGKEWNGQLYRYGTGKLTQANGAGTSSTSLTVDNAQYLKVGMLIDLWDGSTKDVDGIEITAISGTTITLASAQTWADNAAVTRKGVASSATAGTDMMGLLGIVDDGTFVSTLQNIARSGNPHWQAANIQDSVGSWTTNDVIQDALDDIDDQGGEEPDVIITTRQVRTSIARQLLSMRRFTKPFRLEGGFRAIDYEGIPVVADSECPKDHSLDGAGGHAMFILNLDTFWIAELMDWSWLHDQNGGVLRVTGADGAVKDAYVANLKGYHNFVSNGPLYNARLAGITPT